MTSRRELAALDKGLTKNKSQRQGGGGELGRDCQGNLKAHSPRTQTVCVKTWKGWMQSRGGQWENRGTSVIFSKLKIN